MSDWTGYALRALWHCANSEGVLGVKTADYNLSTCLDIATAPGVTGRYIRERLQEDGYLESIAEKVHLCNDEEKDVPLYLKALFTGVKDPYLFDFNQAVECLNKIEGTSSRGEYALILLANKGYVSTENNNLFMTLKFNKGKS